MKKILIAAMMMLVLATSCTEQSLTRNFGGTQEVELKPGEDFINITWKKDALWILTEDTTANTYHFRESSSWGVWEGEVIIKKP